MKLTGKTALITGGTSRQVALTLAAQGVNVRRG